jgi:hypothetical protein
MSLRVVMCSLSLRASPRMSTTVSSNSPSLPKTFRTRRLYLADIFLVVLELNVYYVLLLYRLVIRSLREILNSETHAGGRSPPEGEEAAQVTLRWHTFGWNKGRWHIQGRYLVAKYGNAKGQPMVLLSEC